MARGLDRRPPGRRDIRLRDRRALGGAVQGADADAGSARLAAAARFALTLALVVGVGGAVFLAVVRPDPAAAGAARPAVLGATVAVLPLSALLVGVQGLDVLALPPAALGNARPWLAAWGTPVRGTSLLAAAAAVAALVSLRGGRLAALAAWGLAAISFARWSSCW